jgi:phage-related protein
MGNSFRDSITQRIALDGGNEVKSQLEQIGAAGKKAFRDLFDAASSSGAIDKIGKTFDSIKTKAAEIGGAFGDLGSSIGELGSKIEGTALRIGAVVGAIAAAVGGFAFLVKGAAEAQHTLEATAAAIGVTTKEFQELVFAFGQGGIGQEQFTKGMIRFNRAVDESQQGRRDFDKEIVSLNRDFALGRINIQDYNKRVDDMRFKLRQSDDVFSRLGVTIHKNADGTDDNKRALFDLADVFKNDLPDGAEKSTATIKIFGRGQELMTQILNRGSEGFRREAAEMERVAPAASNLAITAGSTLKNAFEKLESSMESVKNAGLAQFFPGLTNVVDALTEAIAANRDRLITLAADIAATVIPIVDDMIAAIQGRDQDVKNGFILKARDQINALAADTKNAVNNLILPALKALLAGLQIVATAINAVFGTNLTGGEIAIALVITRVIGLFGLLKAAVVTVASAIRLLTVAFGATTLSLFAIGFAVGFFIVETIQKLGGLSAIWQRVWGGIQSLVTQALNRIESAGRSVVAFFAGMWNGALAAAQSAFAAIQNFVTNVFDSIVAGGAAAIQSIIGFFTGLGGGLASAFQGMIALISLAWEAIKIGARAAAAFVANGFNAAVQAIAGFFTGLPALLQTAFQAVLQIASSTWTSILSAAASAGAGITDVFNTMVSSVTGFFASLKTSVLSFFDSIIDKAKKVGDVISSAFSNAQLPGAAGGGEVRAAGGGHIRGRGTSTSDSILARLSNGEFVNNARSVQRYGTAIFHALNRGLLSVGRVRALVGQGINMSGLAERMSSVMPIPGFANGGPVLATAGASAGASGHPVNLTIAGETFNLFGSSDQVERLERFVTRKTVQSSGRKPSWVGKK